MSRSRFAVLGLCVALGACGEKFIARATPDGSSGAASAGRGGGDTAGQEAGGNAGDSAGATADAGQAGAVTADGGAVGSGGTGGTGGLLGTSGGTSGVGGSPIEPTLPHLGLLVWLRADRGIQQVNGQVQGWLDQSGNQTNASQDSTDARPKYLATGFNGRPTLEFDGQGRFLTLPDGFGDFSKGLTGLIVAKPTHSECASMLELSNGSEIEDIALGMWQNKWTYEVESPFIQTGNVNHDAFSLYAANHSALGVGELRINAKPQAMLDMPLPVLPESGVRVNNFLGHSLYGSCDYFEGQISELILYSRSLTKTELSSIEQSLMARWAFSQQSAILPPPAN